MVGVQTTTVARPAITSESAGVSRADVEEFLIHEAALLDEWQLDAWLGLFAPDAHLEIFTNDWDGWGASAGGSFVSDDRTLLEARVKRLKSRKAHAENPRSRTNRIVGNVRIVDSDGSVVRVQANFIVHRYRDGASFVYAGRYDHLLHVSDGRLEFVRRRSFPTSESMDFGARLSFIL